MREFIFSDFVWEDFGATSENRFDEESFLRQKLYSVEVDSEGLILRRIEIAKQIKLRAGEDKSLDFPVEFEFEFDREYLIREIDGKILVEKV